MEIKSGGDNSRYARFSAITGIHRNSMKCIINWIVRAVLLAGLLAFTVLLVWAFDSRHMPGLRIWHTVSLSGEFRACDATHRSTLKDYMDREEQLFRELHENVYKRVESTGDMSLSRYRTGGTQDPATWERNWNRTFELVPENIQGGTLLLHGLTDSPYSLRCIGEILYARGFYVLGLRLPAHGTIPGALTDVRAKDWVAASRIGARHVRDQIGIGPGRPFVIAGYSNGGGLAVKYALDALSEPSLPRPDRLLLFSPEIGIAPLAQMIGSISADQISSYSLDTIDIVRTSFTRWAEKISTPQRPVSFNFVEVSFEGVRDPSERRFLYKIATNFDLSDKEVDHLISAARKVLRGSAEFKAFMGGSPME